MGYKEEMNIDYGEEKNINKGMQISTIESEFQNDIGRQKEKKLESNFMGVRVGSLPSLASTIEEEAVVERRPVTKIMRKLREFSLETTGHGLPRIIEAQQYYMKFIWLCCYLVAILS